MTSCNDKARVMLKKKTTCCLPVLFLCLSFCLSSCIIHQIGGASSHEPEELKENISPGAQKLIDGAMEGILPHRLTDHHVHIVGLGSQESRTYVNPKMQSWGHLLERIKFNVYLSASGIREIENANRDYVLRLIRLIKSMEHPGKFLILAFDKHYEPDGQVNPDKTTFYVSNDYVFQLALEYPEFFRPVISIHPYRADALFELERWAIRGVRHVKWLPSAMGIDPSSPRLDFFYQKMRDYKMVLITHGGEEQAVHAGEDQPLGNPLRLRKPLDAGLRVIVAHAASLGRCEDLDAGQEKEVPCFDLFLRLMDEKKYEGRLFGDISTLLQFNRMPEPVLTLLKRQDLHHRLVNGSDYPLPAINLLVQTGHLARDRFITREERRQLNEIYDYNPLLFDFVLKRTIRHPETNEQFLPSLFMDNSGLEVD